MTCTSGRVVTPRQVVACVWQRTWTVGRMCGWVLALLRVDGVRVPVMAGLGLGVGTVS